MKKGKENGLARGSRIYKLKQAGFGGQTKPKLRRKAKTTKKITLRMECSKCKSRHQKVLGRAKAFELGR